MSDRPLFRQKHRAGWVQFHWGCRHKLKGFELQRMQWISSEGSTDSHADVSVGRQVDGTLHWHRQGVGVVQSWCSWEVLRRRPTVCHMLRRDTMTSTYLVNMEISDLQELIAIFRDLGDCNVQLQILDWKVKLNGGLKSLGSSRERSGLSSYRVG